MQTLSGKSGNGDRSHEQPERQEVLDLAEGVAIVGYGCVLPKANSVAQFWQNVRAGVDCIVEVPADRWDQSLYYDPEGRGDKSYSRIGGFVTDFRFDPIAFRIPPKTAASLDPVQQMTLTAVKEAFVGAGYLDEKLKEIRAFDRERTAVIMGNSMGGEIQREYSRRIVLPRILRQLENSPEVAALAPQARADFLARFAEQWVQNMPPVTEDSMPGELSNVVAGRVANVFDLKGKNHTSDAACASSFAALDAAVKALVERDADFVVCGGADRSMDIDTYVKFCKIGALSARGSSPFDARADGFVMGEGVAVFLLKRLSDAVRDGDTIHAVVRGVGSSSDGKGKGITAPNQRGQVLAVERGMAAAGYEPGTVQYVEAHGTSTKVGDVVELESLTEAYKAAHLPPGAIAIGSVKSQIGHLKSAAGAAALLKTVLALEHKTIPPSIHFDVPNPNVDWRQVPFRVPTQAEPWPDNQGGLPRRAAISSFGFGGTNFHVCLEEFLPTLHAKPASAPARPAVRDPASHYVPGAELPAAMPAAVATIREPAWEAEALVLGAPTRREVVAVLQEVAERFPTNGRLKDLVYPYNVKGVKADVRVALLADTGAHAREQAKFALSCLEDPARMRMAPVKGVFAGEGRPKGKIAFLFPGQGSQYAEMLFDLYEKYAVVRDTFHEADDIMAPLIGEPLTALVFPPHDRSNEEARKRALADAEESLRQTEICQPAVLTADVALWRLLRSLGIEADVVAGHSLGEYAALVAAGILRFEDALFAVSARGKEMAHVDVPDHGKMASITAPFEVVQEVLASCTGYVIPANKNCPAMTVIAGSTPGVEEAVRRFKERGVQALYIPVSAAFHSDIVAPASKPLRRTLEGLSIRPPHTPLYANVTGRPYEARADGAAFRAYVLDMLAQQVASPVEWTDIIRNMYADGVRTFVEVGPKRALTGFVANILEGQDHVAVGTNHPKKGGVYHLNETYAVLAAQGYIPKVKHPNAIAHYTPEHLGVATLPQQQAPAPLVAPAVAAAPAAVDPVSAAFDDEELRTLARDASFAAYAREQAPVVKAMLRAGYEAAKGKGLLPPPSAAQHAPTVSTNGQQPPGFILDTSDLVVSGAALGLPGRTDRLFDDGNVDAILRGENRIDPLTEDERARQTDKNIVRLTKAGDGSAGFEAIRDTAQVIKLAGILGGFDPVAEFGLDGDFAGALDVTTAMAIGAAVDALRDAGIPLVRMYNRTTTGSYLPGDWALPAAMQQETGVVFASAFPGFDSLVDEVSRGLAKRFEDRTRHEVKQLLGQLAAHVRDPAARQHLEAWIGEHFDQVTGTDAASLYQFNRKFLFRVLSMGHSQVAQYIKAKGPNTQVNSACSSTTMALAVAEDWIRTGRCKRVIVVGADAVTSKTLIEWMSSGFLAAGAATTSGDIEQAALPFDRRRHGMIMGTGAVGLVVERRQDVRERGMDGIVKILATQVGNSAFHGSRLDVPHIVEQMEGVLRTAEQRYGFDRHAAAKQTLFMSHETYTPARGGSASAEIASLRQAFGAEANQVLVSNTKGFTGHPMGAGIEDTIAIKSLQFGRVPPVANLKERDPELGDLNLSQGGTHDARYLLRLAAGFGSQIAFWLGERLTKGTERIVDQARHKAWLTQVSGQSAAKLEVVQRTLRVVDQGPPAREAAPKAPVVVQERAPVATHRAAPPAAAPMVTPQPAAAPVAPKPPVVTPTVAARPTTTVDRAAILQKVIDIMVEKTGYPADMLEPGLDLEADLGIDTVKQAELFGIIRETYSLPQEEGMQIKDHPTLNHLADYIVTRLAGSATPAPAPQSPTVAAPTTAATATPKPAQPAVAPAPQPVRAATNVDPARILDEVIALLADKTGYPAEMLEPDLDLEADLGIDTVKQAELFGMIREKYGLPQEEGVQIKEYPTLRHIAQYILDRLANATTPVTAAASQPAPPATPAPAAPTAVVKQVTLDVAAKTTPPTRSTGLALDDGAPTVAPRTAPAAAGAAPPAIAAPRPRVDALGLDDGAPTIGATPMTSTPRPPPVNVPAAARDRNTLDDGAPSLPIGAPVPMAAPAVAPPRPAPAPVAAPATKPPTPAPATTSSTGAAVDAADVLRKVTQLIADKTGYPVDMLEPGLDLEADLGIDTVKQAEIFGEVRTLFGLPLPEDLKIADYPTIERVVGFVLTSAAKSPSPAPVAAQPIAAPAPPPAAKPAATPTQPLSAPAPRAAAAPSPIDAAKAPIRRMVVVPRDASLDGVAKRDVHARGPVVVTQDRLGWAEAFATQLHAHGLQVVVLGEKQPNDTVPGTFVPTDLADIVAVERSVALVRERLGPIAGIVHLAALTERRLPETPADVRDRSRRGVRSLYALARAAFPDLRAHPEAPIVTVTRMGGTFGLPETDGTLATEGLFDPVHAGAAGLTKALAKELPDAFVRVVDLGIEFGPHDAVRAVWSELTHATGRVETGHPALHRRVELDVVPRETLRVVAHPFLHADHVVVSGGGQGVTAAAVAALLERVGPTDAPALTLLGRTPLPAETAALAALDAPALEARKKGLLEQMRRQHERVTPVMLEKEWSKTTKAIEVHRNVERLRALGARVAYHAVDVLDGDALGKVLATARAAHGPITGVVHGAGLEISKLITDKDPAQFDAVFDVKALGLAHLLHATRDDPLRAVCVFSSVAGRFGNAAQVDYSAANDLAVHHAIVAGRARGFRGFGIDWSAWAEVGMATRGGIMSVMEQAGVTPIPMVEGARRFADEWLCGDAHPEVVIAGAVGAIDADAQVVATSLEPAPAPVLEGAADDLPLVDRFVAHVPGRYVVAARRLTLEEDRYMEDHRVDAVPYLPGVFGVEAFAEAALALLTDEERVAGFAFVGAEDVVYHTPVKLLRDRPLDVRVVAERIDAAPAAPTTEVTVLKEGDAEMYVRRGAREEGDAPVRFRCRIESDFVNERGQVLGDVRVHFTGTVLFGVRAQNPVRSRALPVRPNQADPLFVREDIYALFFHGPTFQVLDAVARIEGEHVAALARFDHDGLFSSEPRPRFVTAPLLREAAFQAVGFWAMAEKGRMSLPAGIRRITHHGQPDEAPPGTTLVVLGRFEQDLPDGMHAEYTVETYTPEGLLIDRMEGYRMVTTGSVPPARRERGADDDGAALAPGASQPAPAAPTPPRAVDAPQYDEADDDGDWELVVRDPEGRAAQDAPAGADEGPAGFASSAVSVGGVHAHHVPVAAVRARLDDPGFLMAEFTEAERARLAWMTVPKRRVEHAAGLLAAKRAVAAALAERGVPVRAAQVQVGPDPGTRAPLWSVLGHDGPLPRLSLTVSHSGDHAVAAVCPDDGAFGFGIDVERVEPRDAALHAVAFTTDERALLDRLTQAGGGLDELVTRLWAVKEAVVKGLGTGLAVDLREVRVRDMDPVSGRATLELGSGALRHLPAGKVRVEAESRRFGDGYVGASARLYPDA